MNSSFSKKRILVIGAQDSMLIANHCLAMKKIWEEAEFLLFSSSYEENELSLYKENRIVVFPHNYGKPSHYKNSVLRNLKIADYLTEFLDVMPNFDVCHINYISPGLAILNKKLRKKCSVLISSVWGSDLLRKRLIADFSKKNLYEVSDIITFSNEITMEHFSTRFNGVFDKKLVIARYGLAVLREIELLDREKGREVYKKLFGIPENKICIVCGSNGKRTQQHIEIIKSLNDSLKSELQERVFLLLPMTYGYDENYVSVVEELLKTTHMSYRIVTKRLSDKDMAILRLSCEIMINMQDTDQLSGAMLEHLYAGTIVLHGRWLPYQVLERNGVKMFKLAKINQVGGEVVKIIENLEAYEAEVLDNHKFIHNFASEEVCSLSWKKLYQEGRSDQ